MKPIPTAQVDLPPNMIDFGVGQPDFSILPLEIVRRATRQRLAEGDTTLLNYGHEQGDGYFRRALAVFLSQGYGIPVTADSLLVTGGASQALDMICTLYTKPGEVIFVEEPTYFIALRIFADHGLRVVGIPVDDHGARVDLLEEALTRHRPALLYTIPVFQNPTGVTLSPDRRERLLALARDHDFLIVADEVYQLLHMGAPPPPPMAAAIERGPVISVGSFSKILAPGLRLGWLQAAPPVIARVVEGGLIYSGGSLNHFTSNIVRVILDEGDQARYLADLRSLFQARIARLDQALTHELGDLVRYTTPTGGYFFWLEFPETMDTTVLQTAAQEAQVGFQPGRNFSSNGGLQNFMRLSFAFYNADKLEEGAARLGRLLRRT